MTELKKQQLFTGERSLFMSNNLRIEDCTFNDGESPLKESKNIDIVSSSFQWKYPLWYCHDIKVKDTSFFNMARAGIWYTENITLENCMYEAPKGFRRSTHIFISDTDFPNASETLWSCRDVHLNHVCVHGDYFAMNTKDLKADHLTIYGNYCFDGCENISLNNCRLMTKDAFWNCNNVTVNDSYVSGEYIGWNSENITFVNCTLESLQGFCYMKNVKMVNCKLLNTNLSFEYSTVDADVTTEIDSVKNPISGIIKAQGIKEIIFDDPAIKKENTEIQLGKS